MKTMKKQNKPLLDLLYSILDAIKVAPCNYAIIHNSEALEDAISGDIDLAFDVNPVKIIYPILQDLQEQYGYRLIQCLHYDIPHGYYFIIELNKDYLHLDCLYDPSGISRYHLSTDFLLSNINSNDNTNSVNVKNEYVYNLIKRALKGNLTKSHIDKICQNIPDDESTLRTIEKWIGAENLIQLKELKEDNPDKVRSTFKTFKTKIQSTYKTNNRLQYIYGILMSFIRKANRFIKPTGIFVVIVGPDGCGKSTINTNSTHTLERAFRNTWSFHWRPNLLPKLGASSTSSNFSDNTPSQHSKYKGIISYVRFFYYWLDFVLGYWLVVYPKKAQTTFIIGERYYLDILVHPERYGFSCPKWFIKLFGSLVPKPDMTILLSADPQQIHDRKPELPVNIIAEQISKYTEEINGWGESCIIDTSKDIETSSAEFTDKVLNKCAEKLKKRLE